MKTYQGKSLMATLGIMESYGEKAKVIAGGTDLIIQLHKEKIKPDLLIDILGLEELKRIVEEESWIYIGGATTFGEIIQSPLLYREYRDIIYAAKWIGSPQIRNRGTIGGNLCNGSPAADMVPPLLALESEVILQSKKEQRRLPLEDFFIDKGKTQIRPEEVLKSIRFKKRKKGQGLGFSKLGFRRALAIAKISIGIFIEAGDNQVIQQCRIASGALGPHGLREREVENYFLGRRIEESCIDEGTEILRKVVQRRIGQRFSGGFKTQAVDEVFRQAFQRALKDMNKGFEGNYFK